MEIDIFLGKSLTGIEIDYHEDFKSIDNYILASRISFFFDTSFIQIMPIVETDELDIQLFNSNINYIEDNNFSELSQYINSVLTYTWSCTNTNGYFDVFLLAFNNLKPNIMILCEGSVLKIFKILPI